MWRFNKKGSIIITYNCENCLHTGKLHLSHNSILARFIYPTASTVMKLQSSRLKIFYFSSSILRSSSEAYCD